MFGNLIEEKIREAMEAGEFDNLPGKGQPIDLDAYFATPPDLRLGYSVLKSAGCVPEEVALLKEVEELKAKLADSPHATERQQLEQQVKSRMLKLNLLLDGNQRLQGRMRKD
jgi:hypothetical protein